MQGARGLLISITGGNDLTLYEVDEAASRIRQEVDEDANIILGATFDEALDGVVRVSVVATGIDQPAIARRVHRRRQDAGIAERDPKRLRTSARRAAHQQPAQAAAPARRIRDAAAAGTAAPPRCIAADRPRRSRRCAAADRRTTTPPTAPDGAEARPMRRSQAARAAPRHEPRSAAAQPSCRRVAEQPMRAPRMPRDRRAAGPGQDRLRPPQAAAPPRRNARAAAAARTPASAATDRAAEAAARAQRVPRQAPAQQHFARAPAAGSGSRAPGICQAPAQPQARARARRARPHGTAGPNSGPWRTTSSKSRPSCAANRAEPDGFSNPQFSGRPRPPRRGFDCLETDETFSS